MGHIKITVFFGPPLVLYQLEGSYQLLTIVLCIAVILDYGSSVYAIDVHLFQKNLTYVFLTTVTVLIIPYSYIVDMLFDHKYCCQYLPFYHQSNNPLPFIHIYIYINNRPGKLKHFANLKMAQSRVRGFTHQ